MELNQPPKAGKTYKLPHLLLAFLAGVFIIFVISYGSSSDLFQGSIMRDDSVKNHLVYIEDRLDKLAAGFSAFTGQWSQFTGQWSNFTGQWTSFTSSWTNYYTKHVKDSGTSVSLTPGQTSVDFTAQFPILLDWMDKTRTQISQIKGNTQTTLDLLQQILSSAQAQ